MVVFKSSKPANHIVVSNQGFLIKHFIGCRLKLLKSSSLFLKEIEWNKKYLTDKLTQFCESPFYSHTPIENCNFKIILKWMLFTQNHLKRSSKENWLIRLKHLNYFSHLLHPYSETSCRRICLTSTSHFSPNFSNRDHSRYEFEQWQGRIRQIMQKVGTKRPRFTTEK